MLQEHKYFNALNIALKDDFLNLEPIYRKINSFEKIWLENIFQTPETTKEKNIWEKIRAAKKEIDPDKEWEKIKNNEIEIILITDEKYPQKLKEITYPPLGFYLKGHFCPSSINIAVVGTRRPSYYGKQVAEQLTLELAQSGANIISGLAWGIDTISHKAALKANGYTLAILGSGLDIIYPPINKRLAQEILKNGGLISEYCLNTPPLKHHFPLRNRLISGLADGVVVIEAPLKSGALITAKFALDQNREVFAVPGPIFSNISIGTNRLIQQGAKLVMNAQDIFDEFNIALPEKVKKQRIVLETKQEKTIMALLQKKQKPLLIDEIMEQVDLTPAEVLATITSLELKGHLKNIGGGRYVINQ